MINFEIMRDEDFQKLENFVGKLIDLHNSGENIALFAGAGISVGEPVKLPDALGLRCRFLESLAQSNPHIQLHFHKNKDLIMQRISKIPLELFISILSDMSSLEAILYTLAQEMDSNLLNNAHISTALLCKKDFLNAIITPNFDILLEEALIHIAKELNIYMYLFPLDQTKKYKLAKNGICFLKVHGSISNPYSIAVTLDRLGRGFIGSEYELLMNIFKNNIILVIGWSNNDYDLTPFFYRTGKPIYWINHKSGGNPDSKIINFVKKSGGIIINTDSELFWTVLCSKLGIPRMRITTLEDDKIDLSKQLSIWIGEMETLYGAYATILLLVGDLKNATQFYSLSKLWIDAKFKGFATPEILFRMCINLLLLRKIDSAHDVFHSALKYYNLRNNLSTYLPLILCAKLLDENFNSNLHMEKLKDIEDFIKYRKNILRNTQLSQTSMNNIIFDRLAEDLLNAGFFIEACICNDYELMNFMIGKPHYRDSNVSERVKVAESYIGYKDWRNIILNAK